MMMFLQVQSCTPPQGISKSGLKYYVILNGVELADVKLGTNIEMGEVKQDDQIEVQA